MVSALYFVLDCTVGLHSWPPCTLHVPIPFHNFETRFFLALGLLCVRNDVRLDPSLASVGLEALPLILSACMFVCAYLCFCISFLTLPKPQEQVQDSLLENKTPYRRESSCSCQNHSRLILSSPTPKHFRERNQDQGSFLPIL